MSKDPFQILADEITLIRSEIEKLQRTSLNKDEAKALHQVVAKGVAGIDQALPTLERSIQRQLFDNREIIREAPVMGARGAAETAIVQSHGRSLEEAAKLAQAAGEARRQAWRYFGGFWVWLVSIGTTGIAVGVLAVLLIQGRADAEQFGTYPNVFCSSAKGQKFTDTDGSVYCAILISGPTNDP